MTQYFVDDFQASDLTDFEQLSDNGAHTVTAGTFASKNCLIVSENYSGSISLAYTPAGTPTNYEICALIRLGETASNERFGCGGNMTNGTTIDGYLGAPMADAVSFCRLDNQVRSLRSSEWSVRNNATTEWVWYRFRKSGTDFKVRFWAEGDTEPATWSIETSDAGTVLANGKVGLLSYASSDTSDYVAALGIGTNGDTAPTEAVVAGLTIDSNDASMQRDTNWQMVVSNPSTAPTTLNTTLTNDTTVLAPSSVTGSDPYTLTFPVGDMDKQVDATGYPWTLEITP